MIEIKKILYATDLSENARHALGYAMSLAEKYEAGLALLHVIEDQPRLDAKILGYISAEGLETIRRDPESDARSVLVGKLKGRDAIKLVLDQLHRDTQAELEKSGIETDEVLVVRGNPADQILEQADARNCDLIVMGTHGQGSFKDTMMGSTARRVLRRSSKPVLVIRLPE